GIQQGIQRGGKQELCSSIIDFLQDNGNISHGTREKIESVTDFSLLKKWLKIAAHSTSEEDFLSKIDTLSAQVDARPEEN
ncbi:MAG: hypothetical protein Q4F21_05040, partial [Lachnospiraceae bacterium]|nr:hypothetical protein [Lachnospiraceae bacterium]